jgi:hypothetical protein
MKISKYVSVGDCSKSVDVEVEFPDEANVNLDSISNLINSIMADKERTISDD